MDSAVDGAVWYFVVDGGLRIRIDKELHRPRGLKTVRGRCECGYVDSVSSFSVMSYKFRGVVDGEQECVYL